MRTCAAAVALALTLLTLPGCATLRPCPPGYHLGPAGRLCRPN